MDRTDDASSIQGQILRRSERREVAIYLRDGELWIADFIDGIGELIEPAAWFRFNCGTPWGRPSPDAFRIRDAAFLRPRGKD
jgi:hypothetical protein